MSEFTRQEQLNALSQILRAQLTPTKSGGTLDTDQEYSQLQEMTSISFLLHPKAIFYLARLIANRLAQTINSEVALVEDILVALDNLGQIGKPFTDTTLLSNANTTLLGLDAVASVQGRPEAQRFNRIMDQVAAKVRKNVVSGNDRLIRPREESRNVIKSDLERLKEVHDVLLATTFALRDLIDTYSALDLPAKVAATAFANIRTVLSTLEIELEEATDTENIAMSRQLLLSSLTSKVVVNLVDSFSDPSNVKYKSPNNPEPPDLRHTGQAGVCTPASMITSEAPWSHPRSENLSLAVDGGTTQVVPLGSVLGSTVSGPLLTANNEGPYEIPAGTNIHITVDPEVHSYVTTVSVAVDTVPLILGSNPLRFKHLGSLIRITRAEDPPYIVSDEYSRSITSLEMLQTFAFGGWTGGDTLLFATPGAGAEAPIGFHSAHVGDYVVDLSGNMFEILAVIDSGTIHADLRGITPVMGAGVFFLRGSSNLASITVTLKPDYSEAIRPAGTATVGPSTKTVSLTSGTRTVADVISDIAAEAGVFDTTQVAGAPLNRHVSPVELNNRLVLIPRSRSNAFLQVTDKFIKVPLVSDLAQNVYDTAHVPLGFPTGKTLETRFDVNNYFTAEDLIELILEHTTEIAAVIVPETIVTGANLSTVSGAKTVRDTTVDFVALAVSVGDLVEIGSGDATGTYPITLVSTTELTVIRASDFPSSESELSYSVLRERVKISSQSTVDDTSIEAVSRPTDLALPSAVQYGTSSEFEAVTKQGNKLSFDLAEDDDVLKLPGLSPIEILSVDGTTLALETPVPSNIRGTPFTLRSKMGEQYEEMKAKLDTFTSSRVLLKKNKFDESLDAIDAALTSAVLPGQNFASSRNNAKRLLGDLLSILTDEPNRVDEHGVSPTPAPLNLTDILTPFNPTVVKQLDDLIRMFRERKYERSSDLLLAGNLNGFYATNSETASYGGALLDTARSVIRDLPNPLSSQEEVEEDLNLATTVAEITDADFDFSDTDGEFEIDDA